MFSHGSLFGRVAAGGADMKSIHRSILMRALMTGVASLAFMMMGAGAVRAETVLVQGANGANGADAVNSGEDGMPGGDGESVAAEAGSAHPGHLSTESGHSDRG
jgi:hypothetical protein